MLKTRLLLVTICLLLTGNNAKAGDGVEDIKRTIVSNNTRTFSKENLFKYPKYKDTINRLRAKDEASLTAQERDDLALAQRDKREADGDVPAWNNALKQTQKFIQKHSGSAKSDSHILFTKAMNDIKTESDKLVNLITITANITFGGASNMVFGSKKDLDDKKWQLTYIRNNLDGIIKRLETANLDESDKHYQNKKDCKDVLILTAKYLKASALKASNDMEKEAKKRGSK